jgi:hypothetical protein
MPKLSDQVERKFVDSISLDDWEIETETGYRDITHIHQTIKYQIWTITLEDGNIIKCADTHIFITNDGRQIYAQDSEGVELYGIHGPVKVVSVQAEDEWVHMYDVTVNSENHTFYANGVLSHNTISAAACILHYTLFQEQKSVAILANKGAAAREVMNRYQIMYENLPMWMQQGVSTWNKGNVDLENGSKVFTSATTSSGIRGKSCVTGDTKVCVEENNGIYYLEIATIINNSTLVKVEKTKMFYTVYKMTNNINSKIYVGYHQTTNIDDGYLGSGKLIKRAIEKYGPENFTKEILKIFETKEEAEQYEASIVDKDFTLREDTYNIAVGGNVRIMHGKNNGFYGKQHSPEFKERSSKLHTGNKYFSKANNFQVRNVKTQEIYLDMVDTMKVTGIESKWVLINEIGLGNYEFIDSNRQQDALNMFRVRDKNGAEKMKNFRQSVSDRFKDIPKTQEHREKIGEGVCEFIMNNADAHAEKMQRINTNPEKIRKTAEKHRGMKRSEETRKRISESLIGSQSHNKGKIVAHDPVTLESKSFFSDQIPENWILGLGKKPLKKSSGKTLYNNGVMHYWISKTDTPDPTWVPGRIKHENSHT